jgi:hypothetical protein
MLTIIVILIVLISYTSACSCVTSTNCKNIFYEINSDIDSWKLLGDKDKYVEQFSPSTDKSKKFDIPFFWLMSQQKTYYSGNINQIIKELNNRYCEFCIDNNNRISQYIKLSKLTTDTEVIESILGKIPEHTFLVHTKIMCNYENINIVTNISVYKLNKFMYSYNITLPLIITI